VVRSRLSIAATTPRPDGHASQPIEQTTLITQHQRFERLKGVAYRRTDESTSPASTLLIGSGLVRQAPASIPALADRAVQDAADSAQRPDTYRVARRLCICGVAAARTG